MIMEAILSDYIKRDEYTLMDFKCQIKSMQSQNFNKKFKLLKIELQDQNLKKNGVTSLQKLLKKEQKNYCKPVKDILVNQNKNEF